MRLGGYRQNSAPWALLVLVMSVWTLVAARQQAPQQPTPAIPTAIPTATVVIHFTIIARAAIRFRRISTILLPAARSIIESGRAKNASRFHGPRQCERGGH